MVFSDNLEQWAQQTSSMVSTLYLSFLQTSLTPATKQQHCSIWDHQGTSAPPHLARGVELSNLTESRSGALRVQRIRNNEFPASHRHFAFVVAVISVFAQQPERRAAGQKRKVRPGRAADDRGL